MKVEVIIPTAGSGRRMKSNIPKPFLEVHGKPIIVWTLEAFQKSETVDYVILVGHVDKIEVLQNFKKKYNLSKIKCVVVGGDTRFDSVSNGIAHLDEDTDIVMVHDGARPMIQSNMVDDVACECVQSKALVVAVPMISTIKRVDTKTLEIIETMNRDELWEIQTPQVFHKDILEKAYVQTLDFIPTDDASCVEQLGVKVKVYKGSYNNIKITTPEDLFRFQTFLTST